MLRACLAIAAAVVLPACPTDPFCGPGDATGDGLVLSGGGVEARYHMAIAGLNNDCGDPTVSTEDVVSLTIQTVQTAGALGAVVLCIPRPDLLGDTPMPLVNFKLDPEVHGIDAEIDTIDAMAGGCTLTRSRTMQPSGTISAEGICADGVDPAGFALTIQAQVSIDRDCGGTMDTLRLDLAGTIAVGPQ